MRFDPESYDDVASRIDKFYCEHKPGEGRILTALLSDPNRLDEVVVRAEVFIGEVMVATGLAFEKRGGQGANSTSHLENCETSAIGRALANMNFKTKKDSPRPSRQEMQKTQYSQRQAVTPTEQPKMMTRAMWEKIAAQCKQVNADVPDTDGWAADQARRFMRQLKGMEPVTV